MRYIKFSTILSIYVLIPTEANAVYQSRPALLYLGCTRPKLGIF